MPTFPFLLCAAALAAVMPADDLTAKKLASRAETVLAHALAHEKAFVKVHAAEAMVALGNRADPHRVFSAELPSAYDVQPDRIGVWRVLALSSATPDGRAKWIQRIESVVVDPSATDRMQAVESLAKLGHVARLPVRTAAEKLSNGAAANAVFPRWVLHLAGDRTALPAIVAALDSTEPVARLRAAYVLAWLGIHDATTRAALARTAIREPSDTVGYAIILGAAVTLNADPAHMGKWVAALEEIIAQGTPGARYHSCQAMMRRYRVSDLPRLAPLLDHPEGDARIGAAWAILHVSRKAADGR